MFLTYLLRELRRRMRQSVLIALGLALGVGLVITVTAAANGVSAGQRTVLKSLYGVGTDITVTKSPTAGSGGGPRFRFQGGRPGGGSTSVRHSILVGGGLGTLKSSAVTTVADQKDMTAAVGALVLNDLKLSGTFTPGSGGAPGGGRGSSSSGALGASSFSVTGVDPAADSLGPLASGTITSGHAITSAEAQQNVAVVDSNYAKAESLKTGSTIKVAGKTFTIVGIVSLPQGSSPPNLYIPLARAQALADRGGEADRQVNTIYVSAASAADIAAVAGEISRLLPTATVTTRATWPARSPARWPAPPTWPATWASGWRSRCWPRRSGWRSC